MTQGSEWGAAVCIGSGPSLTPEDVELVRQSGIKTIAVNSSWKVAPFCDVIYAGDRVWWDAYGRDITIKAKRYTCSKTAARMHNAKFRPMPLKPHYNSGLNAVELAEHLGAKVIILLGYDCSVANGLHHHGKHDRTKNPNPGRCREWRGQFDRLSKMLTARVINASRYTELTCFERMGLSQSLELCSEVR